MRLDEYNEYIPLNSQFNTQFKNLDSFISSVFPSKYLRSFLNEQYEKKRCILTPLNKNVSVINNKK